MKKKHKHKKKTTPLDLRKLYSPHLFVVLWPLIFWIWVAWVSLWIEHSPVHELVPAGSSQKFSDFRFEDMRFEQRFADNSFIIVHAPQAEFNSETKTFDLVHPQLYWNTKENDNVFSATGTVGKVSSHVADTSLPSEFRLLELSQGAHFEGQGTIVDSSRMLFDNEKRLFYFPESFTLQTESGLTSKSKERYYNPMTKKTGPLQDLK